MNRPDVEAIRERILYAKEGDIKSAMGIAIYDVEDLLTYIEELEANNRWIPVEKSLPQEEMYLLTLDKQLNIKMVFTKNFSPEDDIICWRPLKYI